MRQKKKYFNEAKTNICLLRFFAERKLINLEETDDFIDSVDNVEIKSFLIDYRNSFDESEKNKLEQKKAKSEEKITRLKKLTLTDYKKLFGMEFVKDKEGYSLKEYTGKDTVISIPDMVNGKKLSAY